jgi:acyl-CoA synthetase (AMP-forming)/AMP-acid ligase II
MSAADASAGPGHLPAPRTFNLADLFEIVADACPHRTALVCGLTRLSYAELDERANRVANHLLDAGLEPGEHVGILSWNRAEWLESMLGCFKASLVPVNINYRYVEDELAYLFDDADLVALIAESPFSPTVEALRPRVPALRHVLTIDRDYESALARAANSREGLPKRSSDDHYLLYTGGTTGRPKGVVWRCEDIFHAAMGGGRFSGPPIAEPEELREAADKDPLVQVVLAPLMHGGGQWVTCITWFGGGTVVLVPEHGFDPVGVLRLAEREQAGGLMVVGDAMARPLAAELAREPGIYDLSRLFVIGSGGAPISPAVRAELDQVLPGRFIADSFGASETGAGGTVLKAPEEGSAGPTFSARANMAVLDDDLRAAPVGVTGLLARSGHIPLGYHKDPVKTAAVFRTDPDGKRWVVPGDHAVLAEDGSFTLLGRGSSVVNTGGEKVHPEEVELVLKAHPDVFDAVVVGMPHPRMGQQVAAVIEPRPGAAPTLEDLIAHCRTQLAGYKIPRLVRLVDRMQRTAVGKADYPWAREVLASESGEEVHEG